MTQFGKASVTVDDSVVKERRKVGYSRREAKQFKARLERELAQKKYQDMFDQMPDCMTIRIGSYYHEKGFERVKCLSLPSQTQKLDPKAFLYDSYSVSSKSPGGSSSVGNSQGGKPYSTQPLPVESIPLFIKDMMKSAVRMALEHGFRHQDEWDEIL